MSNKLSTVEQARLESRNFKKATFEDDGAGSVLAEIVVLNHMNQFKDYPNDGINKIGMEFAAWLLVKLEGDLTYYINPEFMFNQYKKTL